MVKTALFGAGFIVLFVVLGFTAGTLGSLALLYKRQIVLVSALLFILFGVLALMGISIFHERAKGSAATIRTAGTVGTVGFGAIFGLTWTGCIGPVLGLMLVLAANTQTAAGGSILLFAYASGLLVPLIGLSAYLQTRPPTSKVWTLLKGKLMTVSLFGRTLYIHSTNLVAGGMFIVLGILLLINLQFGLATIFPATLTDWTYGLQETILTLVRRE